LSKLRISSIFLKTLISLFSQLFPKLLLRLFARRGRQGGNWHASFLQWSTHFAISGWKRGRGTILAVCKARGLSFANESSKARKTIKAKLAEFFVVRLSIRLVRLRHLHFRARTRKSVRFSRTVIESRCCAHAALWFLPTFEILSWYLPCWRPADDLRTTATTRKEDCLTKLYGAGNEENTEGDHTDSRRETNMERNVVIGEAPFLRFFSRESSGKR